MRNEGKNEITGKWNVTNFTIDGDGQWLVVGWWGIGDVEVRRDCEVLITTSEEKALVQGTVWRLNGEVVRIFSPRDVAIGIVKILPEEIVETSVTTFGMQAALESFYPKILIRSAAQVFVDSIKPKRS